MGRRYMHATPRGWILLGCLASLLSGCATTKESDTARTGIEQLLVSSAIDQALDKIEFAPIRGAKVYLEEKYLDCVDKNYVIVSLEERLLANGCTLIGKPEEADVVMHVTSGGVGTDRQEKFVGISEIPLPPPSPIALPQVSLLSRTRANGTAKLRIVAYDAKSRQPVLGGRAVLARSDFKSWKVMGAGPVESGSVPADIAQATGKRDSIMDMPAELAGRPQPTKKR
jgi:hypothetical protein